MKNLVFVAVIVASLALGIGYLNNTNGIDLWIQQVGVGEADIDHPITTAGLTINIQRFTGATLQGETVVTDAFKDIIVECVFRSPDVEVESGSTLICKLINGPDFETASVVAEGSKVVTSDIPPGTPVTIPIEHIIDNNVNAVQNVIILIQGP